MKKILFAIPIGLCFAACTNSTISDSPKSDSTKNSPTGPQPIPTSVTGTFSGHIPCDCPGIDLSLTLVPDSFTAVVNYKGLRTKGKSFHVFKGTATQDSGLITLNKDSLPALTFKILSNDSLAVLSKSKIKSNEKHHLVRGKRL